MSDAVELARIVQVCLLGMTLVILGARVSHWWCSRWRCLLPAAGTGFIAVFVAAGTVDALIHNRPGGLGSFSVALASVALLMQACTVGIGRAHPPEPHQAGGAYMAHNPDRARPCGPDDPDC